MNFGSSSSGGGGRCAISISGKVCNIREIQKDLERGWDEMKAGENNNF